MKITLIQPPKPFYGVEAEGHWQLSRPFSLFFLASAIMKYTSFEVNIVDFEHKKYRNIPLDEVFKEDNSQIYGITASTFTRFEAINIVKYLKKTRPFSWIIVGGPHFMHCGEDTLKNVSEIDIVVRGEGELILVQLSNAIFNNSSIDNIKGITYRSNTNIIKNPDHALFEDLDSLPFYSGFSWDEYPEYLFGYPEEVRATSIMSSRGCPYKCIFCSKAGMKYRLRNPIKVVDEIKYLKEKFDLEGINFLDLTFTASPRHVQAVCTELINRKLNIKWWCESRANIPLELLDLMKKAGCVTLVVGVESGSPIILKKLSKDILIDQVFNFCKKCKELDIIVSPYFMFSHPDETVEDVEQTIKLISALEKFTGFCSFQPTLILPGTEIEMIAYEKGLLPDDFSWSMPYHNDFNSRLSQLNNIPIFMDKLTPNNLIQLYNERFLRRAVSIATDMKFKDVVLKWFNNIKRDGLKSRYLFSPKAYYNFFINKFIKQD